MRSFLIAFVTVILVITGCGQYSPVCGDGWCDSGEHRSCARDCAEPPGSYCGDDLPADQYGLDLGVARRHESCGSWTWAATLAALADHYRIGVATCDVASDLSGYDCCGYACAGTVCDAQPYPSEVSAVLDGYLGIYGFETGGPVSESRLRTEISNGRPVILGYTDRWTTHLVLITGYEIIDRSWALYRMQDPYNGEYLILYDELFDAYVGLTWSASWTGLSPWPNGCNYDFDPYCGC